MISIKAALEIVRKTATALPSASVCLKDALGLILDEEVASGLDSPPFDKALMDGYAIRSTDLVDGRSELEVIETVTAGQWPTRQVEAGTAIQMMTGAPLPAGADAVIRVEDTAREGSRVRLQQRSIAPETNLMRRGAVLAAGTVVLRPGEELTPSRIGVLAEFGRAAVAAIPRPRVAILATGDELVEVACQPGPGQIRNSNESMLAAQIQHCGAIPVLLGIARDRRDELAQKIAQGLAFDILVLSGGVSAGQLDLVPSELAAAGVNELFHQVKIKPGKPVWFGRKPATDSRRQTLVFGLPGNPVSSMVCFELFVRTAVRRMMGLRQSEPQPILAVVEAPFSHRSDRPTYHPAVLSENADQKSVRILPWQGSSDLCSTAHANALAVLEEGERQYQAGDEMSVLRC